VGTIEPGRRADLIAMADDPLADISAVERLSWVMKDGRLVPSATASAMPSRA
jgi:imidazolonepropionase-like amidohydrolase